MTRPVIYASYDAMKGDARFSVVDRLVMNAICKYANSDGTRCTASNKTISADLCLCERTVERAFTRLIDLGVVTRQRRKHQSAITTVVIQEDQDPTRESVQEDQDPTPESPRPDTGVVKTRHQSRSTVLVTGPKTGQGINMSESDSRSDESEPSLFGKFYALYPRHEKRNRAEKAWNRLSAADQQAALDALPIHLEKWESEQTPKKFIPLPSTWLNDRSWEDEIEIETREIERAFEEIRREDGTEWVCDSVRKDDLDRFGGGNGQPEHPGWPKYHARSAELPPRSIEPFESSPEFDLTAEAATPKRSITERTNGNIISIKEAAHPRKYRPIPKAHRKHCRSVKFTVGQKLFGGEQRHAQNAHPKS